MNGCGAIWQTRLEIWILGYRIKHFKSFYLPPSLRSFSEQLTATCAKCDSSTSLRGRKFQRHQELVLAVPLFRSPRQSTWLWKAHRLESLTVSSCRIDRSAFFSQSDHGMASLSLCFLRQGIEAKADGPCQPTDCCLHAAWHIDIAKSGFISCETENKFHSSLTSLYAFST